MILALRINVIYLYFIVKIKYALFPPNLFMNYLHNVFISDL